MEESLRKYEDKLVRAGLAEKGGVLIGVVDGEVSWSRDDAACDILAKVMAGIGKRAILFARPPEPYRTIIDFLAEGSGGIIYPQDFETRMFLQDLPVLADFNAAALAEVLNRRRGVIVKGQGVVTWGKAGPERAFVTYSSICFAAFVKYFSDYLHHFRSGVADHRMREIFHRVAALLDPVAETTRLLRRGPFNSPEQIAAAMDEVGRRTVGARLVDSNFGNISYRMGDRLYITRKGGALDEVGGGVVAVSLDGSLPPPETASTEFPAHREIVLTAGKRAVLHGHPKFSVILSMDCEREHCKDRHFCHSRCPEKRFVGDIPVVTGEAGGGPHGLSQTVPPALSGRRGVLVYGHGLFTAGRDDFNEAFQNLADIESACRQAYFERVL